MQNVAANIARRLAAEAEAVCRYYLSNGVRRGRYWHVGDVFNTPGQSLFVRLVGPTEGPGAAGKWTDAATGEHGDLVDLIALQRRHTHLSETLKEASDFLSGTPTPSPSSPSPAHDLKQKSPEDVARRLFASARPLAATLGERYLRRRGIAMAISTSVLRYHPRCYYRADDTAPLEHWPALIAAVTDGDGKVCGVHRTYLTRDGGAKARLIDPRRALGNLHGHGVRFSPIGATMVVAEGLETTLSLLSLAPRLPAVAALSTSHLAAFKFPRGLKRIYIAADNDAAGAIAAKRLDERASDAGVECYRLVSELNDWNDDLCRRGRDRTARSIFPQLQPDDRFVL